MFKRSLGTAAMLAGLLAAAAPAHAVVESVGTKYTMLTPPRVDSSKNELAIESIERPFWLPEVNDEVL